MNASISVMLRDDADSRQASGSVEVRARSADRSAAAALVDFKSAELNPETAAT
jgi:hypothetical protein